MADGSVEDVHKQNAEAINMQYAAIERDRVIKDDILKILQDYGVIKHGKSIYNLVTSLEELINDVLRAQKEEAKNDPK